MTLTRWTALAHGLTLAGLLYIGLVWLRLIPYAEPVFDYGPMFDGRGFWMAWDGGLYDIPWLEYEAYVYSPAFAQGIWPLTLLPWPAFALVWTAAGIGALFWMRVPWMIAFPGVIDDILRGNVHVFIAAAIVLGFRYAGAWALPILTKVTPVIGLAWFAMRREWRALGWAAGVTGGITVVSFAAGPDLWRQWIDLLAGNTGADPRIQVIALPLAVRLPVALIVVLVAARMNLRWLLPAAILLGLPNVWPSSLAVLAAAPSLWLADRRLAGEVSPPAAVPQPAPPAGS